MERTPFQTPRNSAPRQGSGPASTYAAASSAKAAWLKELWSIKAMMMDSGLSRERNYQLAAKVVGWQFYGLEELSYLELLAVGEFLREAYQNG